MKHRVIAIITCVLISFSIYAQDFGSYSIKTTLSKEDCMDRIDEWVALNLDSYSLNVDYKNEKTGRTIIKGRMTDTANGMYSVYRNAATASIQYLIVTDSKDNECVVTIKDLIYCFGTGGYVNYNALATSSLELMIDELDTIEMLGESIRITQEFLEKAESVIKEYEEVDDQLKNESLKKSDRKKIEKERKLLEGRKNVYLYVSRGASKFAMAILASIEDTLQ